MESLRFILVVAAEAGVVVALAALACLFGRPFWKRTVWQVCFFGLALIVASEFSGVGKGVWAWVLAPSAASQRDGGMKDNSARLAQKAGWRDRFEKELAHANSTAPDLAQQVGTLVGEAESEVPDFGWRAGSSPDLAGETFAQPGSSNENNSKDGSQIEAMSQNGRSADGFVRNIFGWRTRHADEAVRAPVLLQASEATPSLHHDDEPTTVGRGTIVPVSKQSSLVLGGEDIRSQQKSRPPGDGLSGVGTSGLAQSSPAVAAAVPNEPNSLFSASVRVSEPQPSGFMRAEDAAFWIGAVWGIGTVAFVFRLLIGHLVLASICLRKGSGSVGEELKQRARALASQLGFKREAGLVCLVGFSSPVAFGLARGRIGVPPDFARRFSREEQDAMLAHEFAHLEARDPFWRLISEVVTALLWWHPLVWWGRACLREHSEAAADSASVVVRDGPALLAECLLRIASDRPIRYAGGLLALEGGDFKSGLGKRVASLCKLAESGPEEFRTSHPVWAKAGVALLIAFTSVGAAVVAAPLSRPAELKGTSLMNTLTSSWRQSSAALILATVLAGADTADIPAAQTSDTNAKSTGAPTVATSPAKDVVSARPILFPAPAMDPEMASRYGLVGAVGLPAVPAATRLAAAAGAPPVAAEPPETVGPSQPVAAPAPPPGRPRAGSKMDPELARRYGLVPGGANSGSAEDVASVHSLGPRSDVMAFLRGIVLDEVHFERVPLSKVLQWLDDQVRAKEPGKIGVNFILAPKSHPANQQAPGLPPGPLGVVEAVEEIDPANIVVNISPALKKIRVTDVLDAVVKCSESPITMEYLTYGVVVGPSQAAPVSAVQEPMTGGAFRMDLGMMRRYGLLPRNANAPSSNANVKLVAPSPERALDYANRIQALRIDELKLDGLPLREVVLVLQRLLAGPKEDSINFLFSRLLDAPQWPLSIEARGTQPGPSAVPDLRDVSVKLLLPLRQVSLKEACDAISRVAEFPLRYSVQPYGIVFSPDWSRLPIQASNGSFGERLAALGGGLGGAGLGMAQSAPPRSTVSVRSFRVVDAAGFVAGLAAAAHMDIPASPQRYKQVAQALRKLAEELGTKLDGDERYLHFEERTGMLLVRGTAEDFMVIQALIQTFSGQNPTVESKPQAAIGAGDALKGGAFVSVLGQVNKPGRFEIAPGQKWTVVDAIAAAGGLTRTGNKNKIGVTRQGKETVYRLADIRTEDPKCALESGDLIEVGESLF